MTRSSDAKPAIKKDDAFQKHAELMKSFRRSHRHATGAGASPPGQKAKGTPVLLPPVRVSPRQFSPN